MTSAAARERVEEGIAAIRSARETHVKWRDYYVGGGEPTPHVGDQAHHERYIEQYDNVLRLLGVVEDVERVLTERLGFFGANLALGMWTDQERRTFSYALGQMRYIRDEVFAQPCETEPIKEFRRNPLVTGKVQPCETCGGSNEVPTAAAIEEVRQAALHFANSPPSDIYKMNRELSLQTEPCPTCQEKGAS